MKPSKNKLKWCAKQKYGIKIIKESLNLQKAYLKKSEIFGVSKNDTMEYVDYQKKLRKIIENLTLEKALEIGMSRREFFYLKRKLESTDKPLRLKEKILIRLNNFI